MKQNDTKLYNMIFPIWLLCVIPITWLVVLPANFLIDLFVLVCAMKYLKIEDIKGKARSVILQIWILGFVADIVGGLFMLMAEGGIFGYDTPMREWWNDVYYGVMYNPFDNVFSLLWVTACVIFTAVIIYYFNNMITLQKLNLSDNERKKIALSLSIFTAPYLFYLPTTWFY